MTKIGSRIAKLRENQGLTRYRLAIKSGISFSYMTALEEDKHYPSLKTIDKLAQGLGITVSQLFEEEANLKN
ncbi:helix-turn-helix domain-containing protein [Paenibacillus hamazuiensis]|uniref:helix-turn-helix domain-containing protein n=1 Tax=Paenibacillus hamazuiensis TaxID=2936508 RepID=UPI00200C8855|nr:helix-turn-helix transcriptional regulator [Paenibacillus hamazuiensis]